MVGIKNRLILDNSEIKAFGLALGFPEHLVLSIINTKPISIFGPAEQILSMLLKARRLDRATPENIVYAVSAACQNPEYIANVISLPILKGINSCKLPPDDPCYLSPEESGYPLPMVKSSVPLSMEILSDLPLTYNWYWIGMAMGIEPAKLAKISVNVVANTAFQLAYLLSEPARQLQTGHLYQALQFLGDEEGLRTFPEHLKGEPAEQLSEESLRSLRWGRKLIILATAHAEEDLQVIGEQLGLTKIEVANQKPRKNMSAKRVIIDMLTAIKNQYGQDRIDKYLQRYGHIDKDHYRGLKHPVEQPVSIEQIRWALSFACDNNTPLYNKVLCPISCQLIDNPVALINHGIIQYYERDCLLRWVR